MNENDGLADVQEVTCGRRYWPAGSSRASSQNLAPAYDGSLWHYGRFARIRYRRSQMMPFPPMP